MIECAVPAQERSAAFRFDGAAGWCELHVEYFDRNNGKSKFRMLVGDRMVDEWVADDDLPSAKPNADSSTRRRITGVALRPGDTIGVEGIPDGEERAAVDFIEIHLSPE
jgi:alpha-glucuronidase